MIIYALAPVDSRPHFRPRWAAAAAAIRKWTADDFREISYPLETGEDHAAIEAARASILDDLEQLKDWWSAEDLPDFTQRVFIGNTVLLLFESDNEYENPEPYDLMSRMEWVLGALIPVLRLDVATF